MKTNRKILAVLAHPDDETFGIGGTLAYYAKRDVSIYVICATRGEAGDVDNEYLEGFSSVAERRVFELNCASKVLGINEPILLNYRDSGMNGSKDNGHPNALKNATVEKVVYDIVRKIREIKPQIVITFDPIGGYCHPDHVAIHNATVKAFEYAGQNEYVTEGLLPYQPQRLYLSTFAKRSMRWLIKIWSLLGKDPHRYGRNHDIDLVSIARFDYPVHIKIDYRSVQKIRDRASACYESQGGKNINRNIFGWIRKLLGNKESFMQAYPEPLDSIVERDLFYDMDLD